MSDFIVKSLDVSTWPDFVRLVEKNNGYGVAVGVWPFTRRESGVPSLLPKTDLRKSVVYGKAEHMPLLYTRVQPLSVGVSLGRQTIIDKRRVFSVYDGEVIRDRFKCVPRNVPTRTP